MKRPRPRKNVQRLIRFYVKSKCVKTHRQRITRKQCFQEIGEERLFTKGDTTTMKRRFGRFASIEVTWTAVEPMLDMSIKSYYAGIDTDAAKKIARHGMIG